MPNDKLIELVNRYKSVRFIQTYGLTEASPRLTTLQHEDIFLKKGSVGKAIPGVNIKIVNEKNVEVDPGELGEIVVQGKNVMKGYYRQDNITKQIIIDNWLHTGDYGYLDKDEYLFIVGRKKNIIISGGINIYPEEIEDILLNHENVKEVCITSEEDDLLGEVPIAHIVVFDEKKKVDFRKYCMERISEYKIPRRFEIVDKIEKTYNGKILRNRR